EREEELLEFLDREAACGSPLGGCPGRRLPGGLGEALAHRARDDREPGLVERTRHRGELGDHGAAVATRLDRVDHGVQLSARPLQAIQDAAVGIARFGAHVSPPIVTGRPARYHSTIPPETFTASKPFASRYWVACALRPPTW